MTATADKVTGLVEAKVEEVLRGERGDVLLSQEAAEIVSYLRRSDPDALIDWFAHHAVALIREQLQTRLARARHSSRVSAFREHDDVPPLDRRYAVEEHVWRRIGDMLRPDWQYLVAERSQLAVANLFDIALAKSIIQRLPDDETPTREVVDDIELQRLEEMARATAEQAVAAFS